MEALAAVPGIRTARLAHGQLGLLPPPLWGRVGEGGDAARYGGATGERIALPPPPTPPHKGEGSAPSARCSSASST
jgi:hypothetical protein